jgi:2-haloacid dehalogenase
VIPKAVVFDLYGTLLAIEGAREAVAAAGAPAPEDFVWAWRRKQLEYAFVSSLALRYRDFDELTALALDWTCAQFALRLDPAGRHALLHAARMLPAYPDVKPALRALGARDVPLAVLTNGTLASANAALEQAGVRALLDDVLSVEAVRCYKPDPRVYRLAAERFACEPQQLVFVSSNGWDAAGAASFGLRVAWCNRFGLAGETLEPAPETTLAGLAELEAFVSGLR